jgi:hypothetical protein
MTNVNSKWVQLSKNIFATLNMAKNRCGPSKTVAVATEYVAQDAKLHKAEHRRRDALLVNQKAAIADESNLRSYFGTWPTGRAVRH